MQQLSLALKLEWGTYEKTENVYSQQLYCDKEKKIKFCRLKVAIPTKKVKRKATDVTKFCARLSSPKNCVVSLSKTKSLQKIFSPVLKYVRCFLYYFTLLIQIFP